MMPESPGHDAIEVTPSPVFPEAPPFNPLRLIGFVLLMLLCISIWLRWYTGAVSMPRYCDNPADTLHYLEKVLTEERPAEEHSRRPYIIAAKLLYIIPQQREEPVKDYLRRLKIRIAEQCR
jgi:hypothetical protein